MFRDSGPPKLGWGSQQTFSYAQALHQCARPPGTPCPSKLRTDFQRPSVLVHASHKCCRPLGTSRLYMEGARGSHWAAKAGGQVDSVPPPPDVHHYLPAHHVVADAPLQQCRCMFHSGGKPLNFPASDLLENSFSAVES